MEQEQFHGLRLGPLFLRIGLGMVMVFETWPRVFSPAEVTSLWQALHLPGSPALGYGFEIAKFGSGILIVVGLLTRFLGAFVALAMLGEVLATKAPLGNPVGWALEWQSFWVGLALLVFGAGSISPDALLRRGAEHPPRRP